MTVDPVFLGIFYKEPCACASSWLPKKVHIVVTEILRKFYESLIKGR